MSKDRDRSQELKQTVYPSDPYTAVKHAVYQRYAQCWMGKLLRNPEGAAVIDGFCGSGEYTDGLPGSPIALARTFLDHSQRAAFNRFDVVCLDERADRLSHLREVRDRDLPQVPSLKMDIQGPDSLRPRSPIYQAAHVAGIGGAQRFGCSIHSDGPMCR